MSVLFGGPTDFLRSNQTWGYVLLGVLFAVNWAVVGRVEGPGELAELDYTGRALYRYVVHLSLLVFAIAFVRTRRQIIALTALFIGAIAVTIPGALSAAGEMATKVEALRAAAVGSVRSAENANRLAFMCLMGISITWFALQYYRSLLLRAAGVLFIGVLLLTVFRTGSRSGVLNLVLLAVLLLIQSRMNPGNLGVIVIAAMASVTIVVLLVPDAVMHRVLSVISSTGPLPALATDEQPKALALSNAGRLAVLVAGLKLWAENPLMGIGIGNFRWVTTFDTEYPGLSTAAHNAYVLAAAEGGVLLLAGYLFIFWLAARDLNRAFRQSARLPQVGLRWLVLATRTNLILLLVASLFAEAWKEFYIIVILATTGVLAQIYERAAAEPARPA